MVPWLTGKALVIIKWHHQLTGHEFEQAPGAGNGQESLARCNPWGRKEMDLTEQLNWTEQLNGNALNWECLKLKLFQGKEAVLNPGDIAESRTPFNSLDIDYCPDCSFFTETDKCNLWHFYCDYWLEKLLLSD